MRNKRMNKWIAICLCSVLLTGCGSEMVKTSDLPSDKPIGHEESTIEDGSDKDDDTQKDEEILAPVELEGRYERAAYLADRVYEQNEGANMMVSPLSLDMALGLVSGGAKGQTQEELLTYLETEDYGEFAARYMEYAKGLNMDPTSSIRPSYYKMAYEIANSIWVRDDVKLVEEYANSARKQYEAEIETVSFEQENGADTVKKINAWCNEKTHELIPEIVTEDCISEDGAAILINSLYFESPWSKKWGLCKHSFTGFDGTITEQEMLCDSLNTYYENDKATAFSKSYQNGMKFIGILPKQTGEFTLSELEIEALLESESTDYDVQARMPKLNFETTADGLVAILKAQGVETVFDEEQSDLTGLLELKSDEVAYISDIIQKTKLELDENGTKAAAVTAVMVECAAAMPVEKEIKEVYLDRPFAFVIYDEANDQIVFMGKVATP